jgi:hypothetical protein
MNATESTAENREHIDLGIRLLSQELNQEDSPLGWCLLDATLAGLRLTRDRESRELRRDAVRIWTAAVAPEIYNSCKGSTH